MVLAHLRTDQAPCPWTISKALSISEFHRHVHFFAADFASSALATTPQAQATPKELCRIQRTLYRFELYCNSVGRSNACEFEYFSEEEQRGYFFARFPPWENEQLACVHDYLFEQLSLRMYSCLFFCGFPMLTDAAFNDVAEHDVQWGELRIPYANDWFGIDNTWKEHYLSLGLAYLHQAVTAATYDERYKLITSNMGNDEFFLFEGLKRQGDDDAFELSDFGTEEEDKYLKKHLAVDDDSGPFEAWRWAYADSSRECLYFGDEQRKLRRSAYVMWDLARLSQQGILRTEWVPDPGPVVDPEEYNRRAKEMKESFDERLKVYGRGGLGWWSPGDESKVRWRQQVAEKPKTAPDRSWDKKELWAKDMEQWRNNLKG